MNNRIEDEKIFTSELEEEILSDGLAPLRSLLSVVEDMGEDMYDFHDLMAIVMEKVEGKIQEIFKLIDNQIGVIQVQGVKAGEYFDFEGKRFSGLQRFRAFIAQGGE